jgi:hypothetical protein
MDGRYGSRPTASTAAAVHSKGVHSKGVLQVSDYVRLTVQ